MRLHCVYNAHAGRGKAKKLCAAIESAVLRTNAVITCAESSRSVGAEELQRIADADFLVVIGGDGTLASYIDHCVRTDTAVAFFAAGNESLFQRAFKLPRSVPEFMRVLEAGAIEEVRFARANGQAFFHMLSVGLDSHVVKRVSERRRSTVRDIHYIIGLLSSLRSYRQPCISLTVDGSVQLQDRYGALVVANHLTYAADLCPVPEADCRAAKLCARFFPDLSLRQYFAWAQAYLRKRAVPTRGTSLLCGEQFLIAGSGYAQIDGEYLGPLPVRIERAAERLKVLVNSGT